MSPKLKWLPFGPDEGGVFVFEDVVGGEAVPVIVVGVALGADVEAGWVVACVAVDEEHGDFAAGERDAAAGAGSRPLEDCLNDVVIFHCLES